jgi:hypothetical protein
MRTETMSLEQAFCYTLNFKYFYRRCGMSSQWGNNIRNRYALGILSETKMREVVVRAGYFYRNPESFIRKDIDDI